MVIGENRPFVSALAVLNRDTWQGLARTLGVEPDAPGVLQRPEVRQAVLDRLQPRLAAFPSYARVRGAWLTLEPWTTDNGLITPTMKLRRRQLEQRFEAEIRSIYESPR